jgi:hypothetical protein
MPSDERKLYRGLDYWRENWRRTFSSWRTATGVITFILYVFFIVAAFKATPAGTPREGEWLLRAGALVWLPFLLLVVTPAKMWVEVKNESERVRTEAKDECERLRTSIAAPQQWREQARRFANWGSDRTILGCWKYQIGHEDDRLWSNISIQPRRSDGI